MLKFSANLGLLWPDRPLLQRIDAAAGAGFCAIELHWPYEIAAASVAARCERLNMTLLGINTPAGDREAGQRGWGAMAGHEITFRQSFDQALDYARASAASSIHVMAGNVAVQDRRAAREVFKRNLQYAAQCTKNDSLTLLLEPLNPRDNPGYFYSTLSEAASLIDELEIDNLKLQFDVYHVAISEGDILSKLEQYRSMIGNVQIAAVPSRAEPDEGEIAYGAIFAALIATGYEGWVGCEYRPRGDTDAGLRWRQALSVVN